MKKTVLDFYDVLDELKEERERAADRDMQGMPAGDGEGGASGYKELVHRYIAERMGFPEYYGRNLDALYDCLTDISEPTAVGFFMSITDFDDLSVDLMMYLDKVKSIFALAEASNPENLAVITDEDAGYASELSDPDEELEKLFDGTD